jgi:hypothetical protein
MKTIILQSNNETDINLLIELASRLGVQWTDYPEKNDAEFEFTDVLYEGLGMKEEISMRSLEDFENLPLYDDEYVPNVVQAQQYFGAWANDDNETLEELLNMLTP